MITEEKLDQEWIRLVTKAKLMGIPAEEIRSFLQKAPELEKTERKAEK